MRSREDAFSELTDEILILAIVLILGAIIFVIVFGVVPQIAKGAYISADVSVKQMPAYSSIAIKHRGGDILHFSGITETSYPATIYVDTQNGSYQAVPSPAVGEFRPGNTVYLYYTGAGYGITQNLNGVAALPQPSEDLRVRIVDPVSGLMILEWKSVKYGTTTTKMVTPTSAVPTTNTTNVTTTVTPTATITTTANVTATVTANATATATPTATITATANVTATVTANVTATAIPTTAITSVATTAAPATRTITVIWSPSGLGYGSVSPPTALKSSQEVRVPRGSSKTIYFVPNSNKKVLTIKLDGATVYSGSSTGATISYTVSNIVEDRTITATFG